MGLTSTIWEVIFGGAYTRGGHIFRILQYFFSLTAISPLLIGDSAF